MKSEDEIKIKKREFEDAMLVIGGQPDELKGFCKALKWMLE